MIKIIIDAMGGDNSPAVNVEGAVLAANALNDAELILVGKEPEIAQELAKYTYDKQRIAVVNATDVIDCNDKPTDAIRNKKESSMYKSFELLKSDGGYDAMVSIGSTGSLIAGAVLKTGRIHGVKRPAFCPIMPTMNRGIVAVCDSGANVDCDALQLTQFAVMGSLYMNKGYGIENPRVALLNVGTEEEKGDALRKEVYQILNNTPSLNFVGNMESRDLLKGKYDLVVCDGFAGNVLIKSTEGACLEMLKMLKTVMTSKTRNKIGAMFLKKDIMEMKDFMDYNNYGGAVLLGAAKTIVKGHGSSKGVTVFHCIEQAYNMEKNGLRAAIAEEITKTL